LTVLCAISQNSSMELTIFLVFIKCSDWDALYVPHFTVWIKSSRFKN
jgi:hypothetical protein